MCGNKVSTMEHMFFDDCDTNHPVKITPDFEKSKIWNLLDQKVCAAALETGNLYYTHNDGFIPEKLAADELFQENCMITGTSVSKHGVEFVALVEHKKYPFFAHQYHPEKTQFERIGPVWLKRDPNSIRFVFDFITTIVDQVRKYGKALVNIDPITRSYFDAYHVP